MDTLRFGSVDDIVDSVRRGGVVGIPTDTVYGLACDPLSAAAVERIYAIKRRPTGLELTLLVASIDDVVESVDVTDATRRLADAFWPGPLSLILPVTRTRWAIPRNGSTLSCRGRVRCSRTARWQNCRPQQTARRIQSPSLAVITRVVRTRIPAA